MLDRLELSQELGHDTVSKLFLAYDPAVQHDVVVRRFQFPHHDPAGNRRRSQTILQRVRTLATLRHPHLVPVLHTGEQDGAPYLVLKHIPGRDLGQLLAQEGPLAPAVAANALRHLLDALNFALGAGLCHGNLRPTGIRVDPDGKFWLTGFALDDASVPPSPYRPAETAGQHPPAPTADVYALGLLLLEMLRGQATPASDLGHGLHVPADTAADPALIAIIEQACRQNPQLRYRDAGEMKHAIEAYLGAAALPISACVDGAEDKGKRALDAVINRMRNKADFPALSDSVEAINRLTHSDTDGVSRLSTAILKDYGLTNKILRLVNSVTYRPAGGGSISTISRAVMVLGFDVVRSIVVTAILFDHLADKGNARELKEAFLRASLAGALAREASRHLSARGVEESYIGALFHNLGQLLAQYYFPEEVVDIRQMMAQRGYTEERASRRVLGISFSDLGIGIARYWGFPAEILASLQPLPDGVVRKPSTPEGLMRVVTGFANELRDAIAANPQEHKKKILAGVSRRFASALPLSEAQMQVVMDKALTELTELGDAMQVRLKQSPFATHVRGWIAHRDAEDPPPAAGPARRAASAVPDDAALLASLAADHAVQPVSADAQAILAAGIQDISNALIGDFALNDILRITLETMYRAMDFQRVILFVKDGRSNTMCGRFSVGLHASEMARKFQFALGNPVDVFQLAAHEGTDILISNIDDQAIHGKIPAWYRQNASARTFVLFPLNIKGKSAAMIYGDREAANSIVLPEKELALLKTLRNQALLAIKQTF